MNQSFFEYLEFNSIPYKEVEETYGEDIAKEYDLWIYYNLK